jgi:thiol-disulfide isomerase/thioredoxin
MYKCIVFTLALTGLFILTASEKTTAQTTINYTVSGAENEVIYLGYHYGKKQYINDTIQLDSKGMGASRFEETLHPGVYLLVFPDRKWKEFLVTGKENLKIEADAEKTKLSFLKSKNNQLFTVFQDKMDELNAKKTEVKENASDEATAKQVIRELDKVSAEFRLAFIKKHKGTMVAEVLEAVIEPEVPATVIKDNRYVYFREHFFDHIKFPNNWIVRSPIWQNKLDYFMDKLTLQHYDSVIVSVDKLLSLVANDKELFKHTLVSLVNKYAKSKWMAASNVYVHLVEKYYVAGKAVWASEEQLEKMIENAKNLENNRMGVKARNFSFQDTIGVTGNTAIMGSDYLVLFFWDYDCDHCIKMGKELQAIYKEYESKGLLVLAMYWGENMYENASTYEWKKAIKNNGFEFIHGKPGLSYIVSGIKRDYNVVSTPLMFLLNKDREIIGRHLNAKSLKQILDYELKKKE